MKKTIITTVGTSIFENYNKSKKGKDSNFTANYSKLRDGSYPFSEWAIHTSRIENLRGIIEKTFDNSNCNTSAEIASILSIAKQTKEGEEVKVHLIATDTVLSVLAAELIRDWFKERHKNITVSFEHSSQLETQDDSKHIIYKLQVSSNATFQEGFMNLIEVVSRLIDEGRNEGEVILNITGGYKAIIPIMTLIGQIKKVPLKYIYEESSFDNNDSLVEIGNLPIEFDFSIIDDNYVAFEDIRYNKKDENLSSVYEFKQNLSNEYSFEYLKDKYRLVDVIEDKGEQRVKETFWGSILHKSYDVLYNNKRMVRQSIVSKLIELKVFEFFSGLEITNCVCGHKINSFEVDIFVEANDWVKSIEVKPSANIPIWKKKPKEEKLENSIEKNSFDGAFFQTKQKYSSDKNKVQVELFIYGHNEPHYRAIEQLLELKNQANNPCQDLRIVWLKLEPNYKTNTEWKVENRLKILSNYNKQNKSAKWINYEI